MSGELPSESTSVQAAANRSLRWEAAALVLLPTLAAAAVLALLVDEATPLGLVGEWVWNRHGERPTWESFVLPILGVAGYLAYVGAGLGRLGGPANRTTFADDRRLEVSGYAWTGGLIVVGGLAQWACFELPPPGRGPERFGAAIHSPAVSGYLSIARTIRDPAAFVREYETWVKAQDNFHVGTHPPGLFLIHWKIVDFLRRRPELAESVLRVAPARLRVGIDVLEPGRAMSAADRAAIVVVFGMNWLACLSTVLGVHGLVRRGCSPRSAFLAAAVWPTVPATVLFTATSDSLYPPLAVLTVLATVASVRRPWLAIVGGMILWSGLTLSLAFLAAGFLAVVAAGIASWETKEGAVGRMARTAAFFALGVVFPTAVAAAAWGLDLATVWRINLEKHSGFYAAMPRTYSAWVWLDLVEFAVAVGPAASVLGLAAAGASLARPARSGTTATLVAWLATLAILDLSGRNLSEVARLWLFLAPFACAGVGATAERLGEGRSRELLWLALQWSTALAATATVEPLLPVRWGG